MDAEQMAVVARAEKMLADPATYEATLRQVALERLVIRARADMMNEAQQRIEDKRRENEARAITLAQSRFDIPTPANISEAVSFYRDVLNWHLLPVKRVGDELLPVGDGGGKHGTHVIDDERGDDVAGRIRKHGGLFAVDVQASRLAVLCIEPDGAENARQIEQHFKLPVSLGWRVDGVTYCAFAGGGPLREWVDEMSLLDGVRLAFVGVVRLPPSKGTEWITTPKELFKSMSGTALRGLPSLPADLLTVIRDLRRASNETRIRYVSMILQNADEREASTKARSKK